MRISSFSVLWLVVALMPFSACQGSEEPKLTWKSPKLLEVKKEFDELLASFTEPSRKSNYEARAIKIGNLLKKRVSHQEMSDLAVMGGALPVEEKDWGGFEYCLILEMVSVFLDAGDRDSLVALFSNRLPTRYHFMDIEDMVVRHGTKLKDPVLVLFDAYSKCQVPETREQIAQAIRRGFKGSGIRGNDDADFVKNALRWYNQEKANLVFNPGYCHNRGIGDGYIRNPLFVRKAPLLNNSAESTKTKPAPTVVQAKPLKTTLNSIGTKMVLIPAGDFQMGSPEGEKGRDARQELVSVRKCTVHRSSSGRQDVMEAEDGP